MQRTMARSGEKTSSSMIAVSIIIHNYTYHYVSPSIIVHPSLYPSLHLWLSIIIIYIYIHSIYIQYIYTHIYIYICIYIHHDTHITESPIHRENSPGPWIAVPWCCRGPETAGTRRPPPGRLQAQRGRGGFPWMPWIAPWVKLGWSMDNLWMIYG